MMPSIRFNSIDNVIWGTQLRRPPFAGSIHIWRLQLSQHLRLTDKFSELLTEDEIARSKSYLDEKDRQRFILSRGMLRSILAKYLSEPAENIRFAKDENNKPFIRIKTTEVHYNIAHAGDWVLIAVSGSPVGIDVEQIRDDLDYGEILPLCFNGDEAASIHSQKQFYKLWTRKEALVKATGKGIDNDLSFVPCMDGSHYAQREKIGSDKDWIVSSFEMTEGYTGSIACNPSAQDYLFFEASGVH